MENYTKGKWTVEECKMPEYRIQSGPTIICWTGFAERPSDLPLEERKANARLIAAAPDLLEACEEYQRVIEKAKDCLTGDICSDIGLYELDVIIEAAISKAVNKT